MLTFDNIETDKKKLPPQDSYNLGDVDTEQLLVSKKISFCEKNDKYFIGYLYNGNPLNMLPKTSLYVKQNID